MQWTLIFLVGALIAAALGFSGVAGTFTTVAQVLFVVFLALLVISGLSSALRGQTP